MNVFPPEARPAEPVDPKTFTGPGSLERIPGVCATPPINAYYVRFQAGTRTAWHAHTGPQILVVTEGLCRVQVRGGRVLEVAAGGVVTFDPGEEHWHGAGSRGEMAHMALNVEAETRWLEKVTDEEYEALEPGQD